MYNINVCIYVCTYLCIACMYVCRYVRTYVRMYVCMYVCMYVFEQLKEISFLVKRQVFQTSFNLAAVFKGYLYLEVTSTSKLFFAIKQPLMCNERFFFYLKKKCFVLEIFRFLYFCEIHRFQNLCHHNESSTYTYFV